jgi:hypothetical protein
MASVACVLVLCFAVMRAAAVVSWEDTLTDPQGDVMYLASPVTGHGEVDILSVSVLDLVTDINVTLTLAGAYNITAQYQVVVTADGTRDYTFQYVMLIHFTASGPGGGTLTDVLGNASADGRKLSWVLPKADITVSDTLEIKEASATLIDLTDFKTYIDTAEVASSQPMKVELVYAIKSITRIEMSITMFAEGDMAKQARASLDENDDGTVSQAEKDAFVAKQRVELNNDTELNMTLDGSNATGVTYDVDYVGVVGPADSTSEVKVVMSITVVFPDVDSAKEHTYRFGSGDGSLVPGDMLDDVTDDSVYRIVAPSGWRFDKAEWPAALRPYFSTDGSRLEIEGKDFGTAFGGTSTNVSMFTLSKKPEDKSPGMGLVLVTAALAVAVAMLATTRRRQS